MSMGVADLIVQIAIEDGLKNLRDNPHHLEFILSRYEQIHQLYYKVGSKYLKNAMELINNQKLIVRPYYIGDQDQYPNVVIAGSYTENQNFLGDFGSIEDSKIVLPQRIYASFDAKKIEKDAMTIAASYKIEDSIWLGMSIVNGSTMVKVKAIFLKNENETVLLLDQELSNGTPLKGWTAKTLATHKGAIVNASSDQVTVQAKLATSGDPDVHRIFAMVLRYCLKRGRKFMDSLGLQNAHMSQTPPVVTDDQNMIMESVFTVEGTLHDSWIDYEFDPVENITVVPTLESTLNSEGDKAKVRF